MRHGARERVAQHACERDIGCRTENIRASGDGAEPEQPTPQGPTSEWDTAAGQAIVEAAGGAVLDPRGRPLRYNQRDTLLNGDFLAFGDIAVRNALPA